MEEKPTHNNSKPQPYDQYVYEAIFEDKDSFVEIDLSTEEGKKMKPLEIEQAQIKRRDSEKEVRQMIELALKKNAGNKIEKPDTVPVPKKKKKRCRLFGCCMS